MTDDFRDDKQAIIRNGAWLAHRYDPANDAYHFVHVGRSERDATPFLTDEHLPQAASPLVITRAEAMALAPPPAPMHMIFHSAYCCSTLLARALDIPGISSTLKEPVILNDIVGWRHRQSAEQSIDRRRVAMVLDHAMAMMGRPILEGEAVIVKPSNIINPLANAILAMRPQSKAVLLHAPLDRYLASIASKGMWGRHWVRDLLVKLLREGVINLGFDHSDYLALTDLQVAAVGWLAQQAMFYGIAETFGADRIIVLNSEKLIADPMTVLFLLAKHFGLAVDHKTICTIVEGPAFRCDAKTGGQFSPDQRETEQIVRRSLYNEEIDMVLRWAKVVASNAGVSLIAPDHFAIC